MLISLLLNNEKQGVGYNGKTYLSSRQKHCFKLNMIHKLKSSAFAYVHAARAKQDKSGNLGEHSFLSNSYAILQDLPYRRTLLKQCRDVDQKAKMQLWFSLLLSLFALVVALLWGHLFKTLILDSNE